MAVRVGIKLGYGRNFIQLRKDNWIFGPNEELVIVSVHKTY